MNLALEFAAVKRRETEDGRFVIWITNGPASVELDLWAEVPIDGAAPRPLCELILRQATRALAAPESEAAFVPQLDSTAFPWQVGLRLVEPLHVEAHPPNAGEQEGPGGSVVVGDPAFRLTIVARLDSVTLRTDRAGIESIAAASRVAIAGYRSRG